jgi:hypothetical protein
MERALKSAAVLVLACFFALMWGLYLQRQIMTRPTANLNPGYENLLRPQEEERVMVWGIYFGNTRVGRTRTRIVRESSSAMRISSNTRLSPGATRAVASLTGRDEPIVMEFQAEVAPLRGLQHFHLEVEALDIALNGRMLNGTLQLTGNVGGRKLKESMPMGRNPVVGSTFSPISSVSDITKDNIGESWQFTIVQPLTGELQKVSVTPVTSTMVPVESGPDAEPEPVFKLQFRWNENNWSAWVRADGEPLVQQLPPPLPLTLRREDINDAAINQLRLNGAIAP